MYTLAMWSWTAWVTSLTCSGLFQIWSNSCMYCSVIGASSSRFTARHGIAALVTEIGGGEPLKLGIGSLVINDRELLHRVARGVRAEGDLAANPVRALSCDRALGELVAA